MIHHGPVFVLGAEKNNLGILPHTHRVTVLAAPATDPGEPNPTHNHPLLPKPGFSQRPVEQPGITQSSAQGSLQATDWIQVLGSAGVSVSVGRKPRQGCRHQIGEPSGGSDVPIGGDLAPHDRGQRMIRRPG